MTWQLIQHLDEVSDDTLLECMGAGDEARRYIIDRWPHMTHKYLETGKHEFQSRIINMLAVLDIDEINDLSIVFSKEAGYAIMRIFYHYRHTYEHLEDKMISKNAVRVVMHNCSQYHGMLPNHLASDILSAGYDEDFVREVLEIHLQYADNKIDNIIVMKCGMHAHLITEWMIEYAITHYDENKVHLFQVYWIKQLIKKRGFSYDLYDQIMKKSGSPWVSRKMARLMWKVSQ